MFGALTHQKKQAPLRPRFSRNTSFETSSRSLRTPRRRNTKALLPLFALVQQRKLGASTAHSSSRSKRTAENSLHKRLDTSSLDRCSSELCKRPSLQGHHAASASARRERRGHPQHAPNSATPNQRWRRRREGNARLRRRIGRSQGQGRPKNRAVAARCGRRPPLPKGLVRRGVFVSRRCSQGVRRGDASALAV